MKRLFDLIISISFVLLLLMPIVIIAFAVRVTSNGPIIYWSDRIGRNNIVFKMPKFRTMKYDTPPMATHLMKEPHKFLSPIGGFLRKYSLDEIPQLYSIIKGNMSLVGPRPALFNQYDLIKLRTENKLDNLVPGLTGWAQINGRDDLSIDLKVALDKEYLKKKSFSFDLKILFLTIKMVTKRSGITH
jgi:O-antigen biosynthesis protein WbqP